MGGESKLYGIESIGQPDLPRDEVQWLVLHVGIVVSWAMEFILWLILMQPEM